MRAARQSGFSLVELLISTTLVLVCLSGLARMVISSSRINRAAQMTATLQSDARNCLSMVVQKLRGAGWDPRNAGHPAVVLDPDLTDAVSEIEIVSDLDEDGVTVSLDEQILIRHAGTEVAWRRSSDPGEPFAVLAEGISNDADGDGVAEPMFVADSGTHPARITVRITARSAVPSPVTGEFLRYTLESEVTLRKAL